MASSSLIIFQRTKLSTWNITHLCWCNSMTVWRNNTARRSPRGLCSCTTMPRLTRHLQPRRNWPTWASNVLITHPILRPQTGLPGLPMSWSHTLFSGPGPVGLPLVPWTEGNNWKFAIFRPMQRLLLPRRPGWTDNIMNFFFFFEWLAKVRAAV